ncbi:MAG: hypothetical protein Q4Q06_04205 [Bacteroidota bacterium]|nr:hypothetical protein [Bacteroidota bacterium]
MKKIKTLAVLLMAIVMNTGLCNVFASKGIDGKEDKKSYFGFGVSTNVFGFGRGFDNFNYYASDIDDRNLNKSNVLGLKTQEGIGLFADYLYQSDEWNAIAVRLKYNYRRMDYVLQGSGGWQANTTRLRNIEIPFMYKHTFHKGNTALFTGIIGLGVDFTISSELLNLTAATGLEYPVQDGEFVLTKKRDVNPFFTIGFAINKKINNHRIETSLLFNVYPLLDNYKYEFVNSKLGRGEDYNKHSTSFDNHNIAISVAYYL